MGDALLLYSERQHAWFAPIADFGPAARELFVKGYLNRGRQNSRTVYQITRRARDAQELHALTAAAVSDN